MKIYVSTSNDPFYNLSIENWLFKEILLDTPILYLWKNSPCVIIGRAQNPWRECNLEDLFYNSVPIIRRQSGGGAVYHDLGNLNYTIMMPRALYNKRKNIEIIIEILKFIGIKANITSEYDIVTTHQGIIYKISGTAFRETKNNCFQHGTLLISTEIKKIYQYLHHKINDTLQAKGVYSVRSKVINLNDINSKISIENIHQFFLNKFYYHITYLPKNLCQPLIKNTMKKFKSWLWCFAKTLPFSKVINFNQEDLILNIEEGRLIKIHGGGNNLKNLKYWIATKKPKYNKCSFITTSKKLTLIEKQILKILFNNTPEIIFSKR